MRYINIRDKNDLLENVDTTLLTRKDIAIIAGKEVKLELPKKFSQAKQVKKTPKSHSSNVGFHQANVSEKVVLQAVSRLTLSHITVSLDTLAHELHISTTRTQALCEKYDLLGLFS